MQPTPKEQFEFLVSEALSPLTESSLWDDYRDAAELCTPEEFDGRFDQAIQDVRLAVNSHDRMKAALEYVVRYHREHDSGEGELFGLDFVTACIAALRDDDPNWTLATAKAEA